MKQIAMVAAFLFASSVLFSEQHAPTPERPTLDETGSQLIDRLIKAQWHKRSLLPAERTEDWEFLRRSTLDFLGRLPLPEEREYFESLPAETKRSQWCDKIMSHSDLESYWGTFWSESLSMNDDADQITLANPDISSGLTDWKALAKNILEGKLSRSLKTSLAGEKLPREKIKTEGETTMIPFTVATSRALLGSSIACAQCHDHIFEPYTQSDFWALTANFRTLKDGKPPMTVNSKDPEEKEYSAARSFFGVHLSPETTISAAYIESPKFPKAIVNQVWGQVFGRGLNAPNLPSEVNDPNKPINHPELLESLANKFKDEGYDQKKLMNWMCKSQTYSLKSSGEFASNEDAETYFAKAATKPLNGTQIFRSLVGLKRIAHGKAPNFASREFTEAFSRSITNAREVNPKTILYLIGNKGFQDFLNVFWAEHIAENPGATKASAVQYASTLLLGKPLPENVLKAVVPEDGVPSAKELTEITADLMSTSFFLRNQ